MTEIGVAGKTEAVVIPSAQVNVSPQRASYEERLAIFAGGRVFYEPNPGFFPDANSQRCQACESAAPRHLRLIEDIEGNRYLVGQECYFHLRKAFEEWPEVKRLGRDFELWIKQNEFSFKLKPTWQLVELYIEREAKDAEVFRGFV
jgi:hypothetical protein